MLNTTITEILQIGSHAPNMIALKFKEYITKNIKLLGIHFARQDMTKQNYNIIAINSINYSHGGRPEFWIFMEKSK